ncbi:alpha/beta fold hydrolase [Sphingomonas sp. RB1R13]|uniref:alpha/beta fold hydrolase n=1 Tax=Sphingomonas sp. RB1R13 TaxID=3096159 RepID=UPI002FCA7E83
MTDATALLLAGNMCDERLWTPAIRALLPRPRDVDLSHDDSIAAMAERALAAAEGPLLPVGFSMGAIVALAIAERAPERLAGLVLLDCNPAADLPERAAVRPRQQADVRCGRLLDVVVDELKPNYLADENLRNEPLLTLLRDMAMALGPDTFVRQSEALRTRPSHAHVAPSLDCPIFVAVGAEDRLCPPEWHARLAAGMKRAELHIIPGAGHMLPLEQPAALAAALGPWLESL